MFRQRRQPRSSSAEARLWWPRFERRTDRYGTVFLRTGPDAEDYVSFENAPVGQPGRLVAVVVETRRSGHCGDIARSLAPVTPSVGEEITLGAGTLFTGTVPTSACPPPLRVRRDNPVETGERIMNDVIVPPIPLSLQHLPTVGGLVVPWITPRTADGR